MNERGTNIQDKSADAAKRIGALIVVTAVLFQAARELLLPGIGLAAAGIIFERKKST